MAVIAFGYAMYLSTQVKLVPYIVEVDKLGTAATAGFPEQIEYADVRVRARHARQFRHQLPFDHAGRCGSEAIHRPNLRTPSDVRSVDAEDQ